ncbi:hypothetical protein HPB51_026113 [Rhipicephalus microplus]|uniref:Uncharacterized protein n=1 Tax=Rhipicephalus microplus TaxID=6941 RepID=A0A9J6FB75_RHIMP|nr:hypothetical protein HPB51_026113 [Rhipicephalus microplus]
MKRHSATTKQRSLASYFKKVRTDEADGEEPPPSKDKTSPSSALVESQARPNFCSDSGECTGLYESPENEHKQDTHAPPGNDGGRSATPSDLCSTVNAGQSDAFTTGQCPRKVNSAEQANERCGDAGKPRGKQTAEKTTHKVSWVTRQLPPCSSKAGCVPMADLEDLLYARVECSLAKSVGCTDSAIGIQH